MSNLGFDVLLKGTNFIRLLQGLWVAIRISLISVVLSIALGLVLGILMSLRKPVINAISKVYLEIVRIMPQMVLLFIVYFGESRNEALALEKADVFVPLKSDCDGNANTYAFAFRFIFIKESAGNPKILAEYEYLPVKKVGSFKSDEKLTKIWDVSAYTFELNTREGFLDGIKRDRWVWSGDAYQSAWLSSYIYDDNDTIKRTITMLMGKAPFDGHLNTISDYSFYWYGMIREYYERSGDVEFLKQVYPKMTEFMKFIESKLDEDGMYVRRPYDWVFIDWHQFDKDSGPMSAEQMLLWYAYDSMVKVSKILNKPYEFYEKRTKSIKKQIEKYWNESKGAYVDDYKTGNENVTRHANIFAVRFGLTTEKRKKIIFKNVILNDNVPKITTPFFKFFEIDALGEGGYRKKVVDIIRDYYGGMIDLGATSMWEDYDPADTGSRHYEMYGRPFGKSLCHAWGASTIYLAGRYILGVKFGKDGKSFTVEPLTEYLENYEGTVPVPGGVVTVKKQGKDISVSSDSKGGVLILGGKTTCL